MIPDPEKARETSRSDLRAYELRTTAHVLSCGAGFSDPHATAISGSLCCLSSPGEGHRLEDAHRRALEEICQQCPLSWIGELLRIALRSDAISRGVLHGEPMAPPDGPDAAPSAGLTPRAIAVLVSLRRGPMGTLQIRNSIGDETTQETRTLLACMSANPRLICHPEGDPRWRLAPEGTAWLQRRGLGTKTEPSSAGGEGEAR